jgi:hypothetical protein
MKLYRSWREAPGVPEAWSPTHPQRLRKIKIKNKALLAALRAARPGRWFKVYHGGEDGSAIHYCQHESGEVFDVEYHAPKRLR